MCHPLLFHFLTAARVTTKIGKTICSSDADTPYCGGGGDSVASIWRDRGGNNCARIALVRLLKIAFDGFKQPSPWPPPNSSTVLHGGR